VKIAREVDRDRAGRHARGGSHAGTYVVAGTLERTRDRRAEESGGAGNKYDHGCHGNVELPRGHRAHTNDTTAGARRRFTTETTMAKPWRQSLRDAAVSGSIAAVTSTAVLAAAGRVETGSAFAPTNAISHAIFGDAAAQRDDASARHTLVGFAIHHAASVFWALVFERSFGRANARGDLLPALGAGMAVSALACFVDYQLTPKRLQPGYEMRLSRPALAAVYAAFGAGLALGAVVNARASGPRARRP
jgi:hypothetical protein